MAVATLRRSTSADPQQVWAVLTDFTGHGDLFPLTSVTSDPGPPGVGWRFVARSGVGPLAVRDEMVLTAWEPPLSFELDKVGDLAGGARVRIEPTPTGCVVTWREEIRLRGRLGRLLEPATALSTRWLTARAAARSLRRAEAGGTSDAAKAADAHDIGGAGASGDAGGADDAGAR